MSDNLCYVTLDQISRVHEERMINMIEVVKEEYQILHKNSSLKDESPEQLKERVLECVQDAVDVSAMFNIVALGSDDQAAIRKAILSIEAVVSALNLLQVACEKHGLIDYIELLRSLEHSLIATIERLSMYVLRPILNPEALRDDESPFLKPEIRNELMACLYSEKLDWIADRIKSGERRPRSLLGV